MSDRAEPVRLKAPIALTTNDSLASHIAAIGFDSAAGLVAVQLKGRDKPYHYRATQQQFDDLAAAESKGRHFNIHFRQAPVVDVVLEEEEQVAW
jgi:hypothetical protein